MKQKISLSFDVPDPSYSLAMLEVYQQKDQIVAVSKLSHAEGAWIMLESSATAEVEVEISDENATLPVKHYVICESTGWWTQNALFTTVKSNADLASLKLEDALCLHRAESVNSKKALTIDTGAENVENKAVQPVAVEKTAEPEFKEVKSPLKRIAPVVAEEKRAAVKKEEACNKSFSQRLYDTSVELLDTKNYTSRSKNFKIGAAVIGVGMLGLGIFGATKLLKPSLKGVGQQLNNVKKSSLG